MRGWPGNGRRRVVEDFTAPHPISVSNSNALLVATSPASPMNRGRFLPGVDGHGTSRETHDPGALQAFRGQAMVAQRMDRLRAGMQAGPSSQPANPSTGTRAGGDVRSLLAGMDLPEVLR